MADGQDLALVVALPARHLASAAEICGTQGSVILPAGGPGDLDAAPAGVRVLVIVSDDPDRAPGAGWEARFAERVDADPSSWPEGVPPTWAAERAAAPSVPPPASDREEDDEDDDDGPGPQSFLRVTDLVPLPPERWIHANELVPKQSREGRTFLPRTPRLIRVVE